MTRAHVAAGVLLLTAVLTYASYQQPSLAEQATGESPVSAYIDRVICTRIALPATESSVPIVPPGPGSLISKPTTPPSATPPVPVLSGQATPKPAAPAWVHPLAAHLATADCSGVLRGLRTADLYRQTISWDVPIRTWAYTYFNEKEGAIGGGSTNRDGTHVQLGKIACAGAWYHYWVHHEFWVAGYGRCQVADSGGGWSSKHQFDLYGTLWQAQHETGTKRMIVIYCPHPETCDCDFAVAWRARRGAASHDTPDNTH